MHRIEIDGVVKSLEGWAREYGIGVSPLRERLKKYPPKEAIEICLRYKGRKFADLIEYNGVSLTIEEWAKKTGLLSQTIRSRIRRGYPIEKVLYCGNVNSGEFQEDIAERRAMNKLKQAGLYEDYKKMMDKELERKVRSSKSYRVRWCDRTAHSHTWYTDRVPLDEIDEFIKTHYLARVVGV